MHLMDVSLDDKFTLEKGRIFLTGTQALVRIMIMQRRRDVAAGLNTAGYVSGYRGSPLGGMDREFKGAAKHLDDHRIRFHPGLNEDLAATALWGAQQVNMYPGAKYDGVFGMWYGKGPGVDRSGDVFRHANFAGTSKHGGVLVLTGDDPACKSSTVPSQSEHALADATIPILNPINVQEILDFGLLGIGMSRYSGCWVGMKCITDNVDTSASVAVDPDRIRIVEPADFEMPVGGLHIRWPDPPLEQERRLHLHKIYAALAFARANAIDRVEIDTPNPRFGIVSTGKAYLDTLQALDDLGIDREEAERMGLRLYKVGMPWPLEKEGVREFAEGLDEILIIEEKRAVIENQLKEQLYNWQADKRPRVVGKFDEFGNWHLPSAGELTPARIARVISDRIGNFYTSRSIIDRLEFLEAKERALDEKKTDITRIPYFCSGCPHNTSTKVPEGSRAMAGIGCHYMVTWMDRSTTTFTHMGAEGVPWIGQAPFTDEKHVFVNLGDGTYFHSGILAIRAAVAAGVNITYKILYNDAVAMTGGQPMDGPLDVPTISRQVEAEGVKRIVVVTDEPDKYPLGAAFAKGVTIHHRDDLETVQRDLRDVEGVSVLIYDQTCAAEKRRRRKRGLYPDPLRRAFINELVCEGCGDCGITSNCVSLAPVDTELGRKRAVEQSSCNKDYTCIDGFCPSFVTVEGAEPRRRKSLQEAPFEAVPDPDLPPCETPYSVVVTGIGGTGIVTVSALIAMAAHMEGKGVTALDMAGLAQKNGAVYSHLRIADEPEKLHAVRIAADGADLLIGCDMVTAGSFETLSKLHGARSQAVVNGHELLTADFTRSPDLAFPENELTEAIRHATRSADFLDATGVAAELLGDAIATNIFMIGYAYQKGLLPLSGKALEAAIELNGVAVAFNKRAFLWGRRAAHDMATVRALIEPKQETAPEDGATFVERRINDLTAYQNAAYAARYRGIVESIEAAERAAVPGRTDLTDAVSRALFKVMAYKDEYEVARLYTDGRFERALAHRFQDGGRVKFHLSPPLFAQRDPQTGHLLKKEFGPWMMGAFRTLSGLKGLRGTPFDIFGMTGERRAERKLIDDYTRTLDTLAAHLTTDNHALAVEIAELPMTIRGFGHVKAVNLENAKAREAELLAAFRGEGAEAALAAE